MMKDWALFGGLLMLGAWRVQQPSPGRIPASARLVLHMCWAARTKLGAARLCAGKRPDWPGLARGYDALGWPGEASRLALGRRARSQHVRTYFSFKKKSKDLLFSKKNVKTYLALMYF